MEMKKRYQIWMILGVSCLIVILPYVGYGANLTIGTNISTNGTISATSFVGDGSQLTNVTAAKWKVGFVAVVAKSGGDYTDPVTAMTQLSAWCPSPPGANRCLLKIMPGSYDIGSNSLQMQPYVDLEGSGENVTLIFGNNSTGNGVVQSASNAEIRFLTVENTGGGAYSIALANIANSPKITNVTLLAANGTNTWGVNNYGSSPTMTHVTVETFGNIANDSIGVKNRAGSVAIMSNMNILAASGPNYNVAIWNENNSQAYVGDTVAHGIGGTYAAGFYGINTAGPSQLNRSSFQASGGSGFSRAIRNDSSYVLQVGHSSIVGEAEGLRKCAFCFNANYDPLDSICLLP